MGRQLLLISRVGIENTCGEKWVRICLKNTWDGDVMKLLQRGGEGVGWGGLSIH